MHSFAVDDQLFAAARAGDVDTLRRLLDEFPDRLAIRDQPHQWSLLHHAAHGGHLGAVDLLLERGLDVNARETGDHTYAMHWAAAAGHLDVVRRLADAGGDVIGSGDDHALEVIGWATGWEGCDDATHRALAEFLVSRGARHHIYSAIAIQDANEVRRVVAADPGALGRRMSHNENFQLPLHFAVGKNLADLVALLLELGADPRGRDGAGYPPSVYAIPADVDRRVMEAIARGGGTDLLTALALGDRDSAERLWHEAQSASDPAAPEAGALHLMAKRGDADAVAWLLGQGADANRRWPHWEAVVTPLHLAAWGGSVEVVRRLLAAGADPAVRDSTHDSDAMGWARHFGRPEIVRLLEDHAARG